MLIAPVLWNILNRVSMKRELFEKFLSNTCTEEELDKIFRLIKDDYLNVTWQKWAEEEWEKKQEVQLPDDSEFDSMLDKIHLKINIRNHTQLNQNKTKGTVFITYITRVAAILLLPVLAFHFYALYRNSLESEYFANSGSDSIEVVSPVGSRSVVQLADGTVVYLNYSSKLKYPQKFRGKKRSVVLSGEAYFKVAHNTKQSFVVRTGKLDIEALGTEFNVLAYPEEKNIETTLVNGKVKVRKTGQNGEMNDAVTMVPGQHLSYNQKTGMISNEHCNIEKYISWKEGKLVFKDESIVTIANKLGKWYNVDFEFDDKESMEYTYTATFVDENLYQILDLLKLATPIEYKILPREKLPNGTFSKQKIIIKKR